MLTRFPILIIYLFIWGISYYIVIENLPKQFQLPSIYELWNIHKNIFYLIKDYHIWTTPLGVSFSVFFEIIINTLLIFIGMRIYNINIGFKKNIVVVTFSHFIFYFQMISEFFFIKKFPVYFKHIPREQFSLFSISYFLRLLKISFEPSLYYLLQTISLFEISYWMLLSYFLSVLIEQSFGRAFKIVASSYLVVLTIWLLAITLISIINSI